MVNKNEPTDSIPRRQAVSAGRSTKCTQIATGIIIVLSGIVIGSGGTILFLKDRIMWHDNPLRGRDPSTMAKQWKATYDLSDEQAEKVEKIATKRLNTRRALTEEFTQRIASEREQFVAEVETILSPEQFQRWKNDLEERGKNRPRQGDVERGHPRMRMSVPQSNSE
ncbi:MAG: hypothetical protein HQ515_12550 [Phycisphaeraceae bacterium]|nr:hypothetical protein [Phycisphaeraceae bacterium]